jgi:hypothetical protein
VQLVAGLPDWLSTAASTAPRTRALTYTDVVGGRRLERLTPSVSIKGNRSTKGQRRSLTCGRNGSRSVAVRRDPWSRAGLAVSLAVRGSGRGRKRESQPQSRALVGGGE